MRIINKLALCLLTSLLLFSVPIVAQDEVLTNAEIISLSKAGIDKSVIIEKIHASTTKFDVSTDALIQLKQAGVADEVVAAMFNPKPAPPTEPQKPVRLKDELTTSFNRLKTSVVTVWTETGHGTGFIIDKSGLILTNQHVVGPAEYIAVQFDDERKIAAIALAASPEKDVAVLWADLDALPDATVAPIASFDAKELPVTEGERVFAIGSPLNQRKIITTGIASKVEERAIISDININHGNSGGPLFNSIGEVVGLTTFGVPDKNGGPGLSGIVRIDQAFPVIEAARKTMSGAKKPSARPLPVDPKESFPIETIKEVATAKKFDFERYYMDVSDFTVRLLTPTLKYRYAAQAKIEAAKEHEKRNKKKGDTKEAFQPFEDLRGWAEYVGEYRPLLYIRVTPEYGESFWGGFRRRYAANYGIHVQANLRFKTDFYRMRLLCGEKEVEPILPAKIAYLLAENNYFVKMNDATYEGFYSYPADAISSGCGKVTLEIYSEKERDKAHVKVLDQKTVALIEEEFRPYLEMKRKNVTP